MAQRLLITDCTHPLGSAILAMLEREVFPVISPPLGAVNWSNRADVQRYIEKQKPDIIVNTLGWSDSGRGLNVSEFPVWASNIAGAAKHTGAMPLHLSSYRVFNGSKSEFSETEAVCPIDAPGQAYVDAEQAFSDIEQHIVLRLSWVFGWAGNNLLTRLLEPLSAGRNAGIFGERRGAPTALDDIARIVVGMLKQAVCGANNWGIFHYCSSDVTTEDEFAHQVLNILTEYVAQPGQLALLDADDPQPQSATLSCRRIHDNFGVQQRTWRKGLTLTVRKWLSEQGMLNEAVV